MSNSGWVGYDVKKYLKYAPLVRLLWRGGSDGVVAKNNNSPRLSPWKPWADGGSEIPSANKSRGRDGVVAKNHNSPQLSPWKPWADGGCEISSASESRGRDEGCDQKP